VLNRLWRCLSAAAAARASSSARAFAAAAAADGGTSVATLAEIQPSCSRTCRRSRPSAVTARSTSIIALASSWPTFALSINGLARICAPFAPMLKLRTAIIMQEVARRSRIGAFPAGTSSRTAFGALCEQSH